MKSNRFAGGLRLSLLASLGLLQVACNDEPECTSPDKDPSTGIVSCEEGYSYRSVDGRCEAREGAAPDLPRVTEYMSCGADAAVCDAFQYGYCRPPSYGNREECASGCLADEDCGPGGSCRCTGEEFGTCAFDGCDSDADCESGYHCASASAGCSEPRFMCQSADDECFGNADCDSDEMCQWDDGHRACVGAFVCGRPFLVEAHARVAPVVPSGAWASKSARPRVDHLSASERAELAQHWTNMGQMEHASIAAFARFSLQLLSLGAPPDLVEACTQALADETAHALLCFDLASAYAGRAIGPGPLHVSGSLLGSSLADIVDLVIAEGCFGETSAALEALEAAETATDPVVAKAYAQIAQDEQRHAELAFRFVRWALQRGDAAVRERIARALVTPPTSDAGTIGVTLPCLAALLGERAPSTALQM
jgi:hypothetical protein